MKRSAAVIMIFGMLSLGAFADDSQTGTQKAEDLAASRAWSIGGRVVGTAIGTSVGEAATGGLVGGVIGGILAPTSTASPSDDEVPYQPPENN